MGEKESTSSICCCGDGGDKAEETVVVKVLSLLSRHSGQRSELGQSGKEGRDAGWQSE